MNEDTDAARSSNTPDSSMGNAGFRTVERRSDDQTLPGSRAAGAIGTVMA